MWFECFIENFELRIVLFHRSDFLKVEALKNIPKLPSLLETPDGLDLGNPLGTARTGFGTLVPEQFQVSITNFDDEN